VLVVEDDVDARRMYATWLELMGFAVAQARDGVEGLACALAAPPDVVLMDLAMPRMDGFETTRRLKSDPTTAAVPVVILSACTDVQDRQRAFEAGAVEFLTKPCDADLVASRLRHYSGQ
jgi:CheY-like chemotaxis protein